MSLLIDAVESKKLDVRLIERNVARGVLTTDDMNKALANLPDDEENAEWVNIDSLTLEADEGEINSQAPNHH
jgi:hypothetical protein